MSYTNLCLFGRWLKYIVHQRQKIQQQKTFLLTQNKDGLCINQHKYTSERITSLIDQPNVDLKVFE